MKLVRIDTWRGPWFSLGIHIDIKHKHIDFHFIWWTIVIGNTKYSVYCGNCQSEIEEDDNACPWCEWDFATTGSNAIDCMLASEEVLSRGW